MDTIKKLRLKARSQLKTIVLPEAEDRRVVEAAKIIEAEGIARVLLLTEDKINPEEKERYIREFYQLRRHKGLDMSIATKIFESPLYYASMMVREGKADGFVAGASHTTPDVARAAIYCLGVDERWKIACSAFIMILDKPDYGEDGTFIFADCGIIPEPDAQQLAFIAVESAELAQRVLDFKPAVAFLSYSTKGSAHGKSIDKVRQAGIDLATFRGQNFAASSTAIRNAYSGKGETKGLALLPKSIEKYITANPDYADIIGEKKKEVPQISLEYNILKQLKTTPPIQQVSNLIKILEDPAISEAQKLIALFKGEKEEMLLSVQEQRKRYGKLLEIMKDKFKTKEISDKLKEAKIKNIKFRVSKSPALIQKDAWALATMQVNLSQGDATIYIHEAFLEGLKNKSPPEQEELLKLLFQHELDEYSALNVPDSEIYRNFTTYLTEKG
ncbi:MAG: phosphate acyltransferase, partial [Candidatus Omnitrophica bacterium]|nr:phosphate acyltransferase [Candidatus Omnitrophota bacterium]